MSAQPPLLCLMGPTAAGKTDLAIALAAELDGELVSVDSALVYRGLDIGAAKSDYPHHLVDIREPSQPYSAAEFTRDACAAIADIRARGRWPILVGGTMLYFRALLMGLDAMPESVPDVRAGIEAEAARHGWPALHAELARVDPEAAARIHPNHSQRISRALEVFRISGVPMSTWQRGAPPPLPAQPLLALAVCPRERELLHRRIAIRFEQMLAAGFVAEVEALWRRGDLDPDLPAIRAVGYRQYWDLFEGVVDAAMARERAIAATRQLAKRQLTWLRKWPDLRWLLTDAGGQVVEVRGEPLGPPLTLPTTPKGAALELIRNFQRGLAS